MSCEVFSFPRCRNIAIASLVKVDVGSENVFKEKNQRLALEARDLQDLALRQVCLFRTRIQGTGHPVSGEMVQLTSVQNSD